MAWFVIGIEITADDLKPDEITSLLGVSPTHHHVRGELRFGKDGTPRRPPKFGRWAFRLESKETDEWDANEATKLFIGKFTADPIVWNTIASRATVRLTIALFLENANQGFSLDPDVLRWLADRNVRLGVDIYEGDSEPATGSTAELDRETPH
jgi:hypothetical protein